MPFRLLIPLLFFATGSFAQANPTSFIKVNFLYGSKPGRQFKATESKVFGGLHGGHVTIQVGDQDYGFRRTTKHTHIFPFKKRASVFTCRDLNGQSRYSPDRKTVTFLVPVTPQQLVELQQIHEDYCTETPYDYAFFGMRCAAATREILGEIGILKPRNRFFSVLSAFYPKRLRKKMFKAAKEYNYEVIQTEGRTTRRWERD